MTDTTGEMYRQRYRATGSDMTVREDVETQEGEDDVIEIRMPIASTGEVRNQGDDPLTRDELNGMARQLKERQIGVFPAHGMGNMIAASKYSPFERLGDWTDAAIDSREEENLLMATARMPDPESLPAATGKYREALAILKEQALRGISQDASIGWREDDSYPGGVDLMEASIVGVGADPRTNTGDEEAEVVARAAVDAGADPADLVTAVRDAVDADRAEYEVGEETVEITPPEEMVNAAQAALDAVDDGLGEGCGTGVGSERARQIIDDAVGPEVVDEIAAYLTSHEEDVTADGTPAEWSDEEWDDCGNLQYAKWGGTGSGDPLAWAQDRTNAVADARGEELPYPDRQSADTENMTDDTDPGDETAGTDSEQDAGDEAGETRAPEDIDAADVAEFVSEVYDGVDAADIQAAMDDAGAEFAGLSIETVGWFFADVLDVTAGEVQDMVEESTDGENESGEDMEGDDEEEDDGEMNTSDADADADAEQSAGTEDDEEDTERSADDAGDSDDGDAENLLRQLETQLDEVEDTREAIRNGEVDLSYAADEAGAEDTDGEDATQRETDDDDLAGVDLRESNIID